jgi:hypothetical protein
MSRAMKLPAPRRNTKEVCASLTGNFWPTHVEQQWIAKAVFGEQVESHSGHLMADLLQKLDRAVRDVPRKWTAHAQRCRHFSTRF